MSIHTSHHFLTQLVARSDLGSLLAMSLPEPLPTQVQPPTHHSSVTPRAASAQGMEFPFSEPSVGPLMQQQTFLSKHGKSQEMRSTQSVSLPAGNSVQVEFPRFLSLIGEKQEPVELLPPKKKIRLELRIEDSGNSADLKDPQAVMRKYAEFANVADMGKLACMLARQSYFGDDILRISTVHGKSPRYRALNPQKLSALLAAIHALPEFRNKSKQEFSLLYMPKISTALSRLCVNLRKMY